MTVIYKQCELTRYVVDGKTRTIEWSPELVAVVESPASDQLHEPWVIVDGDDEMQSCDFVRELEALDITSGPLKNSRHDALKRSRRSEIEDQPWFFKVLDQDRRKSRNADTHSAFCILTSAFMSSGA